ncbi:hypothetical protein ABIQ69_11810 [Agromyces sp. G08B096]|uniref:DUF7657 domain-containing protein n=1 Tax=Agromyces sp. G08B096 TaxID=3156399 RepID=A0AAU7W6B0_9MICO
MLPLIVVALFAVLVGLDLSGSSISAFADHPENRGLIAGAPLGVRSDEYLLETPNAISSARQGMPATAWVGLAEVDQAVAAGGGPTLDWSIAFRAQDWGFALLDPGRGLAWNWWWGFVVCVVATYALFGLLTRRILLSAAFAVIATFTPYSAWWAPTLFLGWGVAAGAAMIAAWQARRAALAGAFALVAAYAVISQTLVLYPGWQISVLIVIALLCVGYVLDRRPGWWRLAWTSSVAILATGGVMGVWYATHSAGIAAIAGTIYPGQRRVEAGSASAAALVDAPLNFWMTGAAGQSLGASGLGGEIANQSGASSSWFPVAVVVIVALGIALLAVRRKKLRVRRDDAPFGMLAGVSAAIVLLLAWALLPLPSWFGAITLLDRIQPARVPLALGFASILLLALATTVRRRPAVWSWPWLAAAALATAALTVWSAESLPWDTTLVSSWLAAASGVVFGVAAACVLVPSWSGWAALVLAVYAAASWLPVNPLQHGISPLEEDPLAVALRESADPSENPRVLVFGDLASVARVRSAGFQSVSGTTPYPDRELMSDLAPDQEALWNNYAQYEWMPAPEGRPAVIERNVGTMMRLQISPCDPVVAAHADPGWVVSEFRLEGYSCLVPLRVVEGAQDRTLHLYAYLTR